MVTLLKDLGKNVAAAALIRWGLARSPSDACGSCAPFDCKASGQLSIGNAESQ